MSNCNPVGAPPTVNSPCAFLPQLRAAMYALMAGEAQAEVRYENQWHRWQKADLKALQHEVRRLEMMCEHGTRGAVRVGPSHFTQGFRYHR